MKLWPFKNNRPSAEEKSLTNPEAWLSEVFGITGSAQGAISDSQALSVPAVSNSILVLSEAAATLRVKVMMIEDDCTECEDKTHPVAKLLHGNVNDWLSGYQLVRDLMKQALMCDQGSMAYVNRINGKPAEIIHYEPGNISVEKSSDGTGELKYRLANKPVSAADIIHLAGPFSKSPLTLAKQAIATTIEMQSHAGNLFKNGARPGGVIEFPAGVKFGEESFKKMQAAWKKAHEGSANSGKTAALYDGGTFKPTSLNSVDAQFLELRKFQNIEIARAFRVPPSMLYELDRATWSNGEQQGKEFLTYSLEPWLRALENALSKALFSPEERNSWKIVFERDDLTRADLGSRATAYSSLVSARIFNPNEIREKEGKPPYEGGELFQNPNITTEPTANPKEES